MPKFQALRPASGVASSVCFWPLRRTPRRTVRPSGVSCTSRVNCRALRTRSPSYSTTTSPSRNPAFSAGLSWLTSSTRTPLVAAVASTSLTLTPSCAPRPSSTNTSPRPRGATRTSCASDHRHGAGDRECQPDEEGAEFQILHDANPRVEPAVRNPARNLRADRHADPPCETAVPFDAGECQRVGPAAHYNHAMVDEAKWPKRRRREVSPKRRSREGGDPRARREGARQVPAPSVHRHPRRHQERRGPRTGSSPTRSTARSCSTALRSRASSASRSRTCICVRTCPPSRCSPGPTTRARASAG